MMKTIEVTAYRHLKGVRGRQLLSEGLTDIPLKCLKTLKVLQKIDDIILTCELLRTNEIVWYIEHKPTQYSLATIIEKNHPEFKDGHLENMKKLFQQIDLSTVKDEIDTNAYPEKE